MSEEKSKGAEGSSGAEGSEPKEPHTEGSKSGVSGTSAQAPQVDSLAVGRTFKKVGEFVVDANFDPTLTPEYKTLNNKFVQTTQEAEQRLATLTASVTELTTKLSQKEGMEKSEKESIETQLSQMRTTIELANTEATKSRIELLRIQTAASKGLPYSHVAYVTGSTAEEVAASVDKVLADFALTSGKVSKEELDAAVKAAAAAARAETEAALKNRGNATEGGDPNEHIFTRKEISDMNLDTYSANRAKIDKQQAQGLIK